MDTAMAVSRERIKALRESRAWSQAHLAEAASLSLRTVQRVEAEGTASAETRLAIAAALDVQVDDLNTPAPVVVEPLAIVEPPPVRMPACEAAPLPRAARLDPGAFNVVAMLAAFTASLLYMMWRGSSLPTEVATHFGVGGDVNGHLSRDAVVTGMALLAALMPTALWVALDWRLKRDRVKIPNADYWLEAPRRRETLAYLVRHTMWLSLVVIAFVTFGFWLIASANTVAGHPSLDMASTMAGVAVFVAAICAWIATLGLRFRHAPA